MAAERRDRRERAGLGASRLEFFEDHLARIERESAADHACIDEVPFAVVLAEDQRTQAIPLYIGIAYVWRSSSGAPNGLSGGGAGGGLPLPGSLPRGRGATSSSRSPRAWPDAVLLRLRHGRTSSMHCRFSWASGQRLAVVRL